MQMNRIKNKKTFWRGIFFMVVFAVELTITALRFQELETIRLAKNGIIILVSLLLGVQDLYRSMDARCAKTDRQNDDEREHLIVLKGRASAFRISYGLCACLTILLAIWVGLAPKASFIQTVAASMFVASMLLLGMMFITDIATYMYHQKRN